MIDNVLKFIISPMGFIVIPLLIMIISAFKRYNNYLDVRKIVKEQYDMLKNNRIVLIIIYVLPIIVAIGIARIKTIDVGIINNVNVVLSILIAMFFSIMSIIINFENEKSENYKKTLRETNNTIMFEILLSVFLLICTFIYMFIEKIENDIILFAISLIIYYLSIVVIMNIFILMKRMYLLYDKKEKWDYGRIQFNYDWVLFYDILQKY